MSLFTMGLINNIMFIGGHDATYHVKRLFY